jgi:methyl coenzyme M reductase beta subunit
MVHTTGSPHDGSFHSGELFQSVGLSSVVVALAVIFLKDAMAASQVREESLEVESGEEVGSFDSVWRLYYGIQRLKTGVNADEMVYDGMGDLST